MSSATNNTCYVQLSGGLGNQLFEIATGYAFCRRTTKTLQLSRRTNCKRGVYWDSFLHKCSKFQSAPLNTQINIWNEPHYHWADIPHNTKFLKGYFQSSRYFNDISGEIRELFTPSLTIQSSVTERYADLLTEKSRRCSVVVHVRRTDYLKAFNFHVVTTPEYYKRAITEIHKRVPGARILVFSDDLRWCQEQSFFPENTVFIDEPDECCALWLMAQFRNYIIANSSFSWWATWLGDRAQNVIAPNRWFGPSGPQDFQDIYEPEWVLMSTN